MSAQTIRRAKAEAASQSRASEKVTGNPWSILSHKHCAKGKQDGYALALELMQGRRDLLPVLGFEASVAAHQRDASRLAGMLEALLRSVDALQSCGANIHVKTPVTRDLLSVGPLQRRAMLPWLSAEDARAVLRDFLELARWVSHNTRIQLVK